MRQVIMLSTIRISKFRHLIQLIGHNNEYGQAGPVGPPFSWSSWSRVGNPQRIPYNHDYRMYYSGQTPISIYTYETLDQVIIHITFNYIFIDSFRMDILCNTNNFCD